MATAQELEDITQCPVCTDQFADPRILPCGHTFCLVCVEAWSKKKTPGEQVECPLCRKPFIMPKDGIGSCFAKNFVAVNLLSIRHFIKGPRLLHTILPWGNYSAGAIAYFGNEVFIARQNSQSLDVYSSVSFKLVRRIDVPGLGPSLFGLAACLRNKCLYLTDYNNHRLHRVDLKGHTTATTNWPVAHLPAGVSVNRSFNVVVTCHGPFVLQEYTTKGSLLRQVHLEPAAWHAVQLSTGDYAVSTNTSPGAIVMIDEDGQFLKRFVESGTSDAGPMQYPGCLAVTEDDNILVADYGNSRLLSIDKSFSHITEMSVMVEGGIQGRSGFCLDESRGRLYIAEWGTHRVLVYDGVSVQ